MGFKPNFLKLAAISTVHDKQSANLLLINGAGCLTISSIITLPYSPGVPLPLPLNFQMFFPQFEAPPLSLWTPGSIGGFIPLGKVTNW